jgi:transcriptional regulator with XRE-family HTH domain
VALARAECEVDLSETTGIKLETNLQQLIRDRGFGGNRKKICAALGISQAALSLYVKGKARPKFEVLVALAEFFQVSLDELVFGKRPQAGPPVDFGPFAGYMDNRLSALMSRADARQAATARIAEALVRHMHQVADELAQRQPFLAGLITDDESRLVEQYSLETWLACLRLDYNLDASDEVTRAGQFTTVVANNLAAGRRYTFFLPEKARNWASPVRSLRGLLQRWHVSMEALRERCTFCTVADLGPNGWGLYRLDVAAFRREHEVLHERLASFISADGWLGYVAAPSRELRADALMDVEHLQQARACARRLSGRPGKLL